MVVSTGVRRRKLRGEHVSVPSQWICLLLACILAIRSNSGVESFILKHLRPVHTTLLLKEWSFSATHSESTSTSTSSRSLSQENIDGKGVVGRRTASFDLIGRIVTAGCISTQAISGAADVARAEYGTEPKMSFPDVVGGMIDRSNKQCLAESLGNRECLVYMEDKEKFLYKKPELQSLLQRLDSSTIALAGIPALVDAKKWTQITGVLTGPMGTLNDNMVQLSKLSSNPEKSVALAKKVKLDIFQIGDGASRKSADLIVKAHEAATADLAAFVNSLL